MSDKLSSINSEYIKSFFEVPMYVSILLGIVWFFLPYSWIIYIFILVIFTILHAFKFHSPTTWRLIQGAFFGNKKYLYELGKYKEKHPLEYLQLIGPDNHSVWDFFRGWDNEYKVLYTDDLILLAAQKGYPEALYEIATREDTTEYASNLGTKFEVLLKSAQLGCVRAQAKLGEIYCNGSSFYSNLNGPINIDYVEAIKWLELAASKNNPEALSDLAEMYQHGKGVPIDENKFITLLRESADLGFIYAKNKIGMFLFRNAKTLKEQNEGIEYLLDASMSGNEVSTVLIMSFLRPAMRSEMQTSCYAFLTYLSSKNRDKNVHDLIHAYGQSCSVNFEQYRSELLEFEKSATRKEFLAHFHLGIGIRLAKAKKWWQKILPSSKGGVKRHLDDFPVN